MIKKDYLKKMKKSLYKRTTKKQNLQLQFPIKVMDLRYQIIKLRPLEQEINKKIKTKKLLIVEIKNLHQKKKLP